MFQQTQSITQKYDKKKKRQLEVYKRNTTQGRKRNTRTNNEQQTNNSCNNIHAIATKTRPNIQTSKNYEQETVHTENAINTTKRRMIRTT